MKKNTIYQVFYISRGFEFGKVVLIKCSEDDTSAVKFGYIVSEFMHKYLSFKNILRQVEIGCYMKFEIYKNTMWCNNYKYTIEQVRIYRDDGVLYRE